MDLKAEPFCLSDMDCQWVTQAIEKMSDEEKVARFLSFPGVMPESQLPMAGSQAAALPGKRCR